MAKNWKHTKKLLENLLCDKLKGRITYQLHCYRPDDNWSGCLEILLDKEPIFQAGSCLPKNPNYSTTFSGKEIRRIMNKLLKNDPTSEPLKLNYTSTLTTSDAILDYIWRTSSGTRAYLFRRGHIYDWKIPQLRY